MDLGRFTSRMEGCKNTEEAQPTGLSGSALTKWAKSHYKALLSGKLENLSVRMNPMLELVVVNDSSELSFLADGAPCF